MLNFSKVTVILSKLEKGGNLDLQVFTIQCFLAKVPGNPRVPWGQLEVRQDLLIVILFFLFYSFQTTFVPRQSKTVKTVKHVKNYIL